MASETDRPPATNEVAELRTRLLEHKLKSLRDLQDSYKEKLAELFFLENGFNMMDFLAWKKRPSATLHNYMTSRKLEEGHEEEITINDEVILSPSSQKCTQYFSKPVGCVHLLNSQPKEMTHLSNEGVEQNSQGLGETHLPFT